jgi:hypothetical protein
MLSFNNKNNFIKYLFIIFLFIGIFLSIQNLFEIHEYIGGERPSVIVVNNYDYSKTIDDTKRNGDNEYKPYIDDIIREPVYDNTILLKSNNNEKITEKFYNGFFKKNLQKREERNNIKISRKNFII